MSTDNNIYRFDYGELNDVSPPSTPIHRPASGRENALTAIGKMSRDSYNPGGFNDRQVWYGVVLRVEPTQATSGSSDTSTGWQSMQQRFNEGANLVRIKVRIPEVMAAIPEPLSLAATSGSLSIDDNVKIDNHPTFVAQTPGLPVPNVGDVVKVRYDRQSGQAIYLERSAGTGVAASAPSGFSGASAFSGGGGVDLGAYNTLSAMEDGGTPQNTDASVLDLPQGAKVWPWRESMRNKPLTLVLFFHGVKGSEDPPYYHAFMFDNEEYGIPASFNEIGKTINNTLFVVPKGHGARWDNVKADLDTLQSDYGITFTGKIMGGWSGGSSGGSYAMNQTDYMWDSVIWADPSPQNLFRTYLDRGISAVESTDPKAPNYQNQTMYYKKENWGSMRSWSDPGFDACIEKINTLGGQSYAVDASHNQIVNDVIKIIGSQVS